MSFQKQTNLITYLASLVFVVLLSSIPVQAANSNIQSLGKPSKYENLNETIYILVSAIGLLTFGIGVYQYSATQKWKKAEFVAEKIKEFESQLDVKNVMLMLDWNSRTIFFSNKLIIKVTDDLLCRVLVPHEWRDIKGSHSEGIGNSYFTEEEATIRDAFCRFFDYFDRFEAFIESGLVTTEQFKPYLYYWLEVIGNNKSQRKPTGFYDSLWSFINFYGYSNVQKLFSRYGYNIVPLKPQN